jgi:hypothetical protein
MNQKTSQNTILLTLAVIAGFLLLWMWNSTLTQADSGVLPPRATPKPTSGNNGHDSDHSGSPLGGYIELKTQPTQPGRWTVVQWQDSQGNWHNVEGWRTHANSAGQVRWWVAPAQFGQKPFRWQVFESQGGALLNSSQIFTLPAKTNDIVNVVVSF